jgi:hypothetical protein
LTEEIDMKRKILALIALAGLAAACHERRQEAPLDEAGIRARAAQSQGDLQRQTPPSNPGQ